MADHRTSDVGSQDTGQLLRKWRERALLTQEQLAARAGLSVRSIRRFERGGAAQSTSIRLLAEALGLSPDERAILVAANREPVPDRLRQLPGPSPLFTGREPELADLDRAADPSRLVIATIAGMPGVGKTALAVQAAHRVASRYPDEQIYLDLHGYDRAGRPVEPGDALDRVLRSLGVPPEQIPAEPDDRAALYRSRLAGHRALILLDNAATEEQVTPLLPGTAGSLVLVTSRRLLTGLDHTHALSLDLLPLPDAVTLFTLAAGEERVRTEPPARLAELVELCGRLPLAVRIAAARLTARPSWPVARLIDRLRRSELEAGERSVTAAIDLSYRQLSAEQQRAYRLLGLHPGADLTAHAAAALLGTSRLQAERLIDQLLDTHLLQEPAPGRFRFHDLVRTHSTARADADEPEPDRRAALTRLFDHYRHSAAVAMDTAYPYERARRPDVPPSGEPAPVPTDPAAAAAWLDSELPTVLAVVRQAADHGSPGHVHHLAAILHVHVVGRGRYATAEALHEQALAVARATGDRAAEQRALADLGRTHLKQGRNEEAADRYSLALALARDTGHVAVEMDALLGLGQFHLLRGRGAQAAEHLSHARRLAHDTGHHITELNALIALGWLHRQLGDYEQAFEAFGQARKLAHDTGNSSSEADALAGLGWQYRQQDRPGDAIACFERAHRIAHGIGSRHGELNAMIGLAAAQRVLGLHDQAGETYRAALALAREIGNRNLEFEALQGMGRLHLAAGRPDQALDCHRDALEVATGLQQAADQANAHDGLAHAFAVLGRREDARRHWRQALAMLTELGAENTTDGEVTTAGIRANLGADRLAGS
ncbi:ATP-binding protein [Pseudonocardia adelaidensis]|uniref:HTH cro/C1-type domain-containing protein n=1 Tax=Pseudonocardia adelaidensis TaxID=648754 RepID=A0ABP9NX29_9PSEU